MKSVSSILLASLLVDILLFILWYVLYVIGLYKVYQKMGEAGWKAFVPLYNGLILARRTWTEQAFWITIALAACYGIVSKMDGTQWQAISVVVGIALIVFEVLFSFKQAKSFGFGTGMGLLLFFFRPVGVLILGFGSAQYLGNLTEPGRVL